MAGSIFLVWEILGKWVALQKIEFYNQEHIDASIYIN